MPDFPSTSERRTLAAYITLELVKKAHFSKANPGPDDLDDAVVAFEETYPRIYKTLIKKYAQDTD